MACIIPKSKTATFVPDMTAEQFSYALANDHLFEPIVYENDWPVQEGACLQRMMLRSANTSSR
jgi:hypothetical protein